MIRIRATRSPVRDWQQVRPRFCNGLGNRLSTALLVDFESSESLINSDRTRPAFDLFSSLALSYGLFYLSDTNNCRLQRLFYMGF
jgi:hypothetical protein